MISTNAIADLSTYGITLKAKQCKEGLKQRLDCNYKIGDEFHLSIAGVGQSDAGVTFIKSNYYGEYYGTFGVLHGCVIVSKGIKNISKSPFDFAFVSPLNGKVYKDWESCKIGQ